MTVGAKRKSARLIGALAMILLLAGTSAIAAGQAKWIKDNATAEEFRKDVSWCNGAAELEVSYLSDSESYRRYAVEFETFETCMRERGWRREIGPGKTEY